MLEIRTGYFAYLKKYAQMGYLPISVAQYNPKWYLGYSEKILAPSSKLLYDYKNNRITSEEFRAEYIKYIKTAQFESIFDRWQKSVEEEDLKGVVLLCFEKPDNFCHRQILRDYLNEKYKLHISELT